MTNQTCDCSSLPDICLPAICLPAIRLPATRFARTPFGALFSPLGTVLAKFAKRLENRAAIRQLMEADEYMLRDIGLSRSDVTSAVRLSPLTDPTVALKIFAKADQTIKTP